MSSRSSSPTPSSRSSEGSAGGGDEDGAARLAQLEALLNVSLGYDQSIEHAPVADEPPAKKQKHSMSASDDDESIKPALAAAAAVPATEIG